MDQQEQMIVIENDETHEQYAVRPEDYGREKDGVYAGYTVVSNEDGTPVEEPAEDAPPAEEPPAKKKTS
jgi:hypothetical protein